MDKKLTVQPPMVAFSAPLTERQVVDLDIKNDWNKAIIFKMKTTKPDAFKMKPVYGLVEAGDKILQKKVILTLKKWDPSKKPKKSDHFTIVMAPAPDKCSNPMKTWKSWKESKRSEASIGACRRQVKITYKGIAAKETKKKPSKAEVKKVPTVKDEEIEGKKEQKYEEAKGPKKEDEAEKKAKRKPKVKEEEKGEEDEEEEEKAGKKVTKGKKEEEEEEEQEEDDEEGEEDEEQKQKPKKDKGEDEKAKKEEGKDKDKQEDDNDDEE